MFWGWNLASRGICESHHVFLGYFLQYDKVLLRSLLDGCYHYLVFMDLVNGYSKPKLFVKEQVSLKNKSDSATYVPCKFCYPSFLLWSSFTVDVALK